MGGGGILPIAIKNGQVHFLFGKENELDDTPGWADFGGGANDGESYLDTALREGSEEINGILGSAEQLRKQVKKNKISTVKFKTYTTYIYMMDYDDKLPFYYKNNYEFFSRYLPHIKHKKDNGLLEKSKIKWFTFDELKAEKKNFRSFYQNIVDLILKQEKEITDKMNHRLIRNTKPKKHSETTRTSRVKRSKQTKKRHNKGKRKHTRKK
jgi:8-oxo-dGTP pyrophosphatase MutT (NUDIX family)|tara:strand:+ start:51 stop:680 length:630 start_codon:yes stop_codon:yes gene_type:complete